MSSNGQREPHGGRLGVRVIPRTGRKVPLTRGWLRAADSQATLTKCPRDWASLGQRDQRGVIPILCREGS